MVKGLHVCMTSIWDSQYTGKRHRSNGVLIHQSRQGAWEERENHHNTKSTGVAVFNTEH